MASNSKYKLLGQKLDFANTLIILQINHVGFEVIKMFNYDLTGAESSNFRMIVISGDGHAITAGPGALLRARSWLKTKLSRRGNRSHHSMWAMIVELELERNQRNRTN